MGYTFDELDNLSSLSLPHGQHIDMLTYGSGHVEGCGSSVSNTLGDLFISEAFKAAAEKAKLKGFDFSKEVPLV